jgi:hypothetical protein
MNLILYTTDVTFWGIDITRWAADIIIKVSNLTLSAIVVTHDER